MGHGRIGMPLASAACRHDKSDYSRAREYDGFFGKAMGSFDGPEGSVLFSNGLAPCWFKESYV